MNFQNPALRFDAMRGITYPHRIAQRVTKAELELRARALGLLIDWNSMRMLGHTTAEVTLTKVREAA